MPEKLTCIIIPIYNESKVIYKLLENEALKKYTLVLVDDGSSDGLSLEQITVPFYFLQHAKNLGQGAALQTGMELATQLHADVAIHFDGDGQHDPADINALAEPVLIGKVPVAIGSRFLKRRGDTNLSEVPLPRQMILQCARIIQFVFTGIVLTDSQNGLRAISGTVLPRIEITENRMAHAIELIQLFKRQRLAISEIPVNIRYTEYSNLKGQKLLNGLFIVLRLFLNKLLRSITISSLCIVVIAASAAYLVGWKSRIFIFAMMFPTCVIIASLLTITRNVKRRHIAATRAIRAEALRNVKKFN
jgi:polyprenyl-phospho-N-acetylgalactosaminyl synthase